MDDCDGVGSFVNTLLEEAQDGLSHVCKTILLNCIYGVDKSPMAVQLASAALLLTGCRDGKQYHKTAKESTSLNIRQGDSLRGYSNLQVIEKCIKHDTLRQDYQRLVEHYKAWRGSETRKRHNAISRSQSLDILRSQKSQSLRKICRAVWFFEPSASSQDKMYKKVQLQNPAVHQDRDHSHWPAEFPEVVVPSCKQPICNHW